MLKRRDLLFLLIPGFLVLSGCNTSGMLPVRPSAAETAPTFTAAPPTPTSTNTRTPTATLTPTDPPLEDAVADIVSKLSEDASRNVLVFVESRMYYHLEEELAVLEADLRNEKWFPVISKFPADSAQEMRQALQTIYSQRAFAGVFLIGDFPYVRLWGYEIQDYNQPGPSDYYYMDLDGEWLDTDKDSFFDVHTNGKGDRDPEVFVGRLAARGVSLLWESELEMTRSYLRRDHAYRTGATATPGAAVYTAPADHYYGWYAKESAFWAQQEIQSIQAMFAETYAFIYKGDSATENSGGWTSEFWFVGSSEEKSTGPAKERFREIMSQGYDYLSIGIHGWYQGWGADFFTSQDAADVYESGGRLPVFIYSGSCSSGNIGKPDSIGAVMTMSGALVVLASSAPAEMTWEEYVLWNHSLGKFSAGTAFLKLQELATPSGYGPVTRNVNWILLGDPTLILRTDALR